MRAVARVGWGALVILGLSAATLPAQDARVRPPDDGRGQAELVVVGQVRFVYRRDAATGPTHLVDLVVQSAQPAAPRLAPGPGTGPIAGDTLFVQVNPRRGGNLPGIGGGAPGRLVPPEGATIRAFLIWRPQRRVWEAVGPNWFDLNPGGGNPPPIPDPGRRVLGVFTNPVPVQIGPRRGLQITSVVPNSPAAVAGFEPGDILLTADGQAITSQARLTELVNQGRDPMRFVVRNVRTGQLTTIPVRFGPQ